MLFQKDHDSIFLQYFMFYFGMFHDIFALKYSSDIFFSLSLLINC